MFGTRGKAVVLVAAAVAGYAGAAAFSALALPSVAIASDYGPGDGLTRYVVTASTEAANGLGGLPGVVNTQRLSDGRTLVATDGLTPAELQRVPGVSAVEASPSVPVMAAVTDPYWPNYGWNLDNTGANAYSQTAVADADTDAPDAWPVSTGSPVVVAVVDTGYYTAHPDLQGALWTNPDCATDADGDGRVGDCHGWNFTTDSPDVDNGSYGTHGTSVAGVIAARAGNGEGSAGVAPGVQIMPLVIGSGESVDVYLGAEAIRYAADHGASVVNASWGGSFSGPALDALESAVAYAASKGVLVVAAAGNDSANRDSSIVYPATLTDPNLVTVGAATAADTVSDFSAYGAASVDLFAPGTLVFTTWNDGGYRLVSGTSIAAPQVAAALALYRAVDPTATTDQLRDRLLADVDPEPAFVGRSVTGGRLSLAHLGDSTEAVRYAFTSMTAPAGVVTPHVTATDPDAAAGSYSVQFGLGMEYAHEVMAFSGAVVTLSGTTATTDDDGLVTFDLGARSALDGLELTPSVDLGDGRYVLTAQVYLDGQPLGRAHAAPLLVGSSVVPGGGTTVGGSGASGSGTGDGTGDPAAGDPTSGDPTSGDPAAGGSGSGAPGSDPGAAGPGSAGSGGSAGDPGSGTAPGSSGGSTPGDPPSGGDQSGSVPEAPDSSVPEVTGGSTPAPAGGSSTDTGSGTSGSDSSGSGSSASGSSGSDSSDAGSGSAGSGDGGSPAPGTGPVPEEGGVVDYPAVGTFRITSLSPARVSTDGGTLVTVTGEALPSGARVLVGSTASATVVRASATELVFRAPARVVGTYSVAVFAPDGRSMVLDNALEYVDTTAGGSGSTPSDAGSGSGTDAGGAGGPGTDSGTGTGGSSAGGSGGSGSAGPGGGSGGSAELVVRRGPNGERLVRSAHFAGLSSIWSLDCSASCTGVAI